MAAMKRQQPIAPPHKSSNPLGWTLEQYLAYYGNFTKRFKRQRDVRYMLW